MDTSAKIKYFGWSSLSVETEQGVFLFDPFYRPYCGADWFSLSDLPGADFIAVTHGHEEHFLDTPEVARHFGAKVIGPKEVTRFLQRRNEIPKSKLITLNPGDSIDVPGFRVDAFGWKHRDINLFKALGKALFLGNWTQLSWAWHSATQAPFYAPYTGYRLTLQDGTAILNYNEGFNSKMTDAEIETLAAQKRTDVLLGGMQLDFIDDVRRGAAALKPKLILLFPPHEMFHNMMGAKSRPWMEFVEAAQDAVPTAKVVAMTPGIQVDLADGAVSYFSRDRRSPGNEVQYERIGTFAANLAE